MDKFNERNEPSFWADQADLAHVRGWLGQTRRCPACNRNHTVRTRMLEQTEDMAGKISRYLGTLGFRGRCLVVMDENTRRAAGNRLLEGLAVYRPQTVIFPAQDVHPDEQSVGLVIMAMAEKPDFMVSCGSGTITDIARLASHVAGIPFIAYATAASVDGFASGTCAMLYNGYKQTLPAQAPDAIFYDPKVLADAPQKMTAAGFGDVLAKIVALIDWRLAYVAEDEPYCPLIAAMVDRAVRDCLALAPDLIIDKADGTRQENEDPAKRQELREIACCKLMDALTLTGLAMQLMDGSRPASGAEHQISHLLEMKDVARHRPFSLHGDRVGIGTLIGMTLYLILFANGRMPQQKPTMPAADWENEVRRVYGPLAEHALAINPHEPPQGEEWENQQRLLTQAMDRFGFKMVSGLRTLLPTIRDLLADLGGPIRPDELGYTVEDTYDAIAFGKENRPKFTVLRLAERYGHLYDLARRISEGLPAGNIY